MTTTKKLSDGPIENKYSIGMRVLHKKFGKGTVIAVKGGGKFIDVAFEGVGIKALAAEIAPLEII